MRVLAYLYAMYKAPESPSYEELLKQNSEQQIVLDSLLQKIDLYELRVTEMQSRVNEMQFQIDQMKRLIFGSKRERFVSGETYGQMKLPFEVEEKAPEPATKEEIHYTREKPNRENHPGRMSFPAHLPVEEIVLEPQEDTTGMKCIGKEITEQLELIPAKLFIKRYVRPKYIKADEEDSLNCKGVIADLPVFPIEKGMAGPGLLAQVMIDKFVDHLPIYRQIERFKREKINIASSTINGWQESVCTLLEPLYNTLKHRVLSQGYLQVDETPIQVLDKDVKGNSFRGYHWVYYSPLEKTVLFDYRDGRSRAGPSELLRNYKGYLQTDGYVVYDFFGKQKEITVLNCMAHARRGFEKALDYDKTRAEYAMGMFQKLYEVERVAKDQNMTPDQRHELRLDKSLPVLNELGKWIAETFKQVLPKSPLGKALAYCIPRWDHLMNYLHDGSLEIDNNFAENAIRPIALGRKNYLFAGSSRGAERAAMFYSFFGTCKKNDVNPYEWLKKVLELIPQHKANKLHELLPQNLHL